MHSAWSTPPFVLSCLANPLSGMSCCCLQIDVVDLTPHVNPALGTTHGATWSGAIGWHTRAGYKHERGYHEACTVYQASRGALQCIAFIPNLLSVLLCRRGAS